MGRTEAAAEAALADRGPGGARRMLPFLGPAFIAAVAYVDPGNFATNIQAGSAYGYLLVWVVVTANIMAMVVQTLSAKLGIATGKNLAELIRDRSPRGVTWALWVLAEIVAMATDLAEFLGAALGFNLLFGMDLFVAGLVTGVATFLMLALQQRGFRPLEALIATLVGVIATCYLVETLMGKPDFLSAAGSFFPPRFQGGETILLATGILGATVMPHVIYLHSSLTQNRIVVRDPTRMKRLFRFQVIDVMIAMTLAGLINAAMLMMAAATFHQAGATDVASIEEAHRTLAPLLGRASSVVFAISLLASGLSSSTVGTMAGQVIMQGFLHRSIAVWIRRVVTMIPALVVIALRVDPTRTLVISQVVLSFGIPFALFPLVRFTAREDIMGVLVNRRITSCLAWLITTLIVGLNMFLIYETFT